MKEKLFSFQLYSQNHIKVLVLISENYQVVHQNKQMSSQSLPISQLTLLKVASTSSKCLVFCEVDSELQKFQLPIDDSTTVELIISETVKMAKRTHERLDLGTNTTTCQLYASRKNGKKVSDLPSFQMQQKVKNTGMRFFYLQNVDMRVKKRGNNMCSISTKSIQSEMKSLKGKEMKTTKQMGCFCFS